LPAAQLGDQGGDCLALDVLHGVEVHALFAPDPKDRHDVGVVELAGRLCLIAEALQLPRIQRGGERQDLEGDPALERQLLRLEDDPHAAPADLADQAEIAELTQLRQPFGHVLCCETWG
jgi:hypothetical protein